MQQEIENKADPSILESGQSRTAFRAIEPQHLSWLGFSTALLVVVQFLAVPIFLYVHAFPPSDSVWVSAVIESAYVDAAIFGIALALIVLIPFLIAWSSRSAGWRVGVYVPLLVLASVSVALLLFLIPTVGTGRVDRWFIQYALFESGLFFVFSAALAVAPMVTRVSRGCRIAKSELNCPVSSKERVADWLVFAGVFLVVNFGWRFIEQEGGFGVLSAGFSGIGVGVVFAVVAVGLLREQSRHRFQKMFFICFLLFVFLPGVAAGLYSPRGTIAFGFSMNFWFVVFMSSAFVLLLHTLLFRAAGYRIRTSAFKKVESTQKTVVDPFSD